MHVPNGDEPKGKGKELLVVVKVQMKTVAFQLLVDPILAHLAFRGPKMPIWEVGHHRHPIVRAQWFHVIEKIYLKNTAHMLYADKSVLVLLLDNDITIGCLLWTKNKTKL